jgi:phenylacetate-CoA ligase
LSRRTTEETTGWLCLDTASGTVGASAKGAKVDARLLARLPWLRRRLRRRDGWSRAHLEAHQARALADLRAHAYARSPFYRRFHAGLMDRPLHELPVLTKATLMEHFDDLVTDRDVHLPDVEAHLAAGRGEERYLGRYRLNATAGSTGRRGLFLFDRDEWLMVLASYARANEWGGARAGLTHRMRLAVVSTTTPWHQSAQVGATVRSRFVPTLRLDATAPLPAIVAQLNPWRPETLVAYASLARTLAEEQLAGRLGIAPRTIFTASEVLTAEARRGIAAAWGREPFDVYGATETAGIAAECERHTGLHLFEDLVIAEVVDERNRPVPPGEYGDKVLVTVLFSRTQPLIRYELSDSVRPAAGRCPCGRPYALLDGIRGRAEDVLHLPALAGGEVAVHPNVFHDVLDLVPAGGWQVVQQAEGLSVLLAGAGAGVVDEALAAAVRRAVATVGAVAPPVAVRRVGAIPRTAAGKTPLIRAERPPR